MSRQPCWCLFQSNETAAMLAFQTDPVGVGLFLCKQLFSFAPINLHRCWPCEWKRSIMTDYVTGRDEVNLQSILIGSWKGEIGLPPTWDCQLCCTRKHQFVDSLLVNDMMAEYFCFNGLWHKPHRQQNLTDIQNFWNLDQNKKSETKQGGRTGKSQKELHETESVGQAAWRLTHLLVWWDMMMMIMTKQAWSIITIIMHNDTRMSLQCLTYNWFTSVLFWCDSRRFPLSITLIVIYVFMVKCL